MSRPDYVYSVREGKLFRYAVESYNEETTVFTATHSGGKVRGSLSCSIFFRFADEALKDEQDSFKHGVSDAMQEVRDAIATYRVINKLACMSFAEFKATVVMEDEHGNCTDSSGEREQPATASVHEQLPGVSGGGGGSGQDAPDTVA